MKNSEVAFLIVSVLAWGPLLDPLGRALGLSGLIENGALLVAVVPISLFFPLVIMAIFKNWRREAAKDKGK